MRGTINGSLGCEFEKFQRGLVTEFLSWQADIVREYKREDQFITQNLTLSGEIILLAYSRMWTILGLQNVWILRAVTFTTHSVKADGKGDCLWRGYDPFPKTGQLLCAGD